MEALIQEETHDLMEVLKQESAKGPVEIKNAFDISVLNTLWAMTAGKRYNLNDERLNYLARLVHDSFTKVDPSGGLLNQMPLLRFLAPNLCGYNLVSTLVNKITHFISESINEHVDTFDADSPRDLIDMFIKKMHSKSETFTGNVDSTSRNILCLSTFYYYIVCRGATNFALHGFIHGRIGNNK